MAHPNNLDRCRTKYLMRNIVSCGAWWWWCEPVWSPLWGMLLEDQLELMLRTKPGAKTHSISHRLSLQHLHFCSEQYSFQHREQRQALAMAASSFMQVLCPDAILPLLWGMCG